MNIFHQIWHNIHFKKAPELCVTVLLYLHVCTEWEAVAMFDYVARSPAELSFKLGDLLILHSKASCDWWRGEVGGVKGLIPHKYISVLDG